MLLSSTGLLMLVCTVTAAPSISYPISIQYPPALYPGHNYSYQLPINTFSSFVSAVDYSTNNLPSWLSFDSNSRSFHGSVPKSLEPGLFWFDLIGTDSQGSTSINSSLLILQNPPIVNYSQSTIDSSLGFSSPSTLALQQNIPFRLSFPTTLFSSSASSYYALTSSHTLLPIWISFNPSSLSFSGTPPPITSSIAPTQIFPISILAVQNQSFAAASYSFNLSLSSHPFTSSSIFLSDTVTPGSSFFYPIPIHLLSINNTPISQNNISSVSINATDSWISVNSSAIYGSVPSSFAETTYLLSISNSFNDSVSLVISLKPSSPIFNLTQSPVTVNATPNTYFQYTVPDSLIINKNASLSASYSSNLDWISFHPENKTFNGLAPAFFPNTTVTLVGRVKNSTQSWEFELSSLNTNIDTNTDTNTNTNTNTQTHTHTHNHTTLIVLCSVLIPLVLFATLFIFYCCFRHKKTKAPIPAASSLDTLHVLDTPLNASKYNLQKLDAHSSINYSIGNNSDVTISQNNCPRAHAAAINERYLDTITNTPNTAASNYQGIPRTSWRQTQEPVQPWHAHQQSSSLATVDPPEKATLGLVAQVENSESHSSLGSSLDGILEPVENDQDGTLEPRGGDLDGILEPIGSGPTSFGSYSSGDSLDAPRKTRDRFVQASSSEGSSFSISNSPTCLKHGAELRPFTKMGSPRVRHSGPVLVKEESSEYGHEG